MDYYSHHENETNRPFTATDVVRRIVSPPLLIFATIVDIIFILIITRYRRLHRDNTFVILANLTTALIYPRLLDILDEVHSINNCHIFYVNTATSFFKLILLTTLLIKSSVNLIFPLCKLDRKQFLILLGIFNFFLLVSIICARLIIGKCNAYHTFATTNVNISFYIGFVILAIIYDVLYFAKNGFFLVWTVEFLIINLNVFLFVVRTVFYIVFSLTYMPLIVLYLFGFIYILVPVYYFLLLYIFSEDFHFCSKQFFTCKKFGGKVVYKNGNVKVAYIDDDDLELTEEK